MDMINKHGHRISLSDFDGEWCRVYDCDRGYYYYEKHNIIFKTYSVIK